MYPRIPFFDASISRWVVRRTLLGWTWMLLALASCAGARSAEDIVLADFDGADYGAWKSEGTAFGSAPARGTLPNQMRVGGFKGKGLVNSYLGGDGGTGALTSPEFLIERPYLHFLIGGGGWEDSTAIRLLVDGKVVRSASGPNTNAGGSEELSVAAWDVREFLGQKGTIEIIDRATGGWGHINVDQIVLSDRKPAGLLIPQQLELRVDKKYLHLPVKNGAPRRKVTVTRGGQTEVAFDIELAESEEDWWAYLETGPWKGETITMAVDRFPESSRVLERAVASDEPPASSEIYRETLRPQFHFSSRRGWNNDPNGMVFFGGEYHLFYQHNPYGWNWGNMHWGHAVSRDLVHWEEIGDALAPDPLGPMFSGSAVVDVRNTSGFGAEGKPAQVLMYTAAGSPTVQCLAHSTDGRTYAKYSGNPVLGEITPGNRDPKVLWHEPTGRWVMGLYVGQPGTPNERHTIQFFTSPDLKSWKQTSEIEGFFECPDFFELPVEGASSEKHWVLTAASSDYVLGAFDGERFTPTTSKLKGHQGRGFYAAQTFNDLPADDGRRIQMGWMQAPSPGMPFNQAMSMPLELRLLPTAEGPRLSWRPVRELEALRAKSHPISVDKLDPGSPNPLADVHAELVELRARFVADPQATVTFRVRGASITYDAAKRELVVLDHRIKIPGDSESIDLAIYVDRTMMEVFAADGLVYVPMPFLASKEDRDLSVAVEGGDATFSELTVYELKSIWNPAK